MLTFTATLPFPLRMQIIMYILGKVVTDLVHIDLEKGNFPNWYSQEACWGLLRTRGSIQESLTPSRIILHHSSQLSNRIITDPQVLNSPPPSFSISKEVVPFWIIGAMHVWSSSKCVESLIKIASFNGFYHCNNLYLRYHILETSLAHYS